MCVVLATWQGDSIAEWETARSARDAAPKSGSLKVVTTHLCPGYLRKNGVHIVRHGDLLTISALIDDPVYFSEPYVRSRVWARDPIGNLGNGVSSPCEPIAELPPSDTAAVVPHYLPGKNPFVNELTEKHNIPAAAVLGGAETMYPEYRKKLTG
jgi:hypothetical protein